MTTTRYIYPAKLLQCRKECHLPVTTDGISTKTWHDFAVAVNGWKLAFEKAGTRRVAIFFREAFDQAAALFGAWAAGIVAVLPADTALATLTRLHEEGIEDFAGDFPRESVKRVLSPEQTQSACVSPIDEEGKLIELFTSGTTGKPTRIVKRLRQLFVEVDSIAHREDSGGHIGDDAVVFSTVSPQHIYGLLFYLLMPLSCGILQWHCQIRDPHSLLHAVRRFRHCVWVASPALLKRLPEDDEWKTVRSHWQVIFSSGGPLSSQGVLCTFLRTGLTPVEFLGSSEAGGIASRQRAVAVDGTVRDTPWQALPAVRWRSAKGVLEVKSPQLANDDWETMPDLIAPCEDGKHFYHLGRADRIVKVEEVRVSLSVLEAALSQHAFVAEAKVLQLEDERHSLVAVVKLSTCGRSAFLEKGKLYVVQILRNHLAAFVEPVCVPKRWRFVTSFPENSIGKTTVAQLQALFAPRALQAVEMYREPAAANFALFVPAGSPYFEGHFPEFHLLPGLAQIEWTIDLARRIWLLPENFCGVQNLKFLSPVLPGSTVKISLQLGKKPNSVVFAWSFENKICAKGMLLFQDDPAKNAAM